MGRGSSKSGGGGGMLTSAPSQSGIPVNLKDFPLATGPKDSTLSDAQRSTIEAFEAKRVGAPIEYVMILDSQGNTTIPYSAGDVRGKKGSCGVDPKFFVGGEILSHNHPRADAGEVGVLGGTFSGADLDIFTNHGGLKTIRATAAEGTYSLSKGSGFNASAFSSYIKSAYASADKVYKSTVDQLSADFKAGKITQQQYSRGNKRAFNKSLVDMHNALLAGQKTHNYSYTLETG